MQPDSNDLVYTSYQIDITGLAHRLLELITGSSITADSILALLGTLWFYYSILALLVSGALIFGIIYAYLRSNELSEVISNRLIHEEELWREVHATSQGNRRWHEIKQHVNSVNPNDWKLAIIEADIMLGEMLTSAGYAGATIADQIRSVPPAQFTTIQDAWDAHRTRNDIAHRGADFVLTQSAAQEAIVKYERVFHEFKLV